MKAKRIVFGIILFLAVGALAHPGVGQAQEPEAAARARSPRTPVTLVLTDRLNDTVAFQVLRRPDQQPHDLILLPGGATAADLSAAVQVLMTARRLEGDTASVRSLLRMRSDPGRSRDVLPWAQRVVDDLRRSAPRTIPDFGTAPAIDIWLPATRRGQS